MKGHDVGMREIAEDRDFVKDVIDFTLAVTRGRILFATVVVGSFKFRIVVIADERRRFFTVGTGLG